MKLKTSMQAIYKISSIFDISLFAVLIISQYPRCIVNICCIYVVYLFEIEKYYEKQSC